MSGCRWFNKKKKKIRINFLMVYWSIYLVLQFIAGVEQDLDPVGQLLNHVHAHPSQRLLHSQGQVTNQFSIVTEHCTVQYVTT